MTTTDLRGLGLGTSDPFDELALNPSLGLEEAAAALDLEPWIVERLRHPAEESTSCLPLVRDNGDALSVPLFQVQHSTLFGSTHWQLVTTPRSSTSHLRSYSHGTYLAGSIAGIAFRRSLVWPGLRSTRSEREGTDAAAEFCGPSFAIPAWKASSYFSWHRLPGRVRSEVVR